MTQLNITRAQYQNLRDSGLSKDEILKISRGASSPKPTDFLDKTAGVFDAIFGGGVIGEAIGTQIAKRGEHGEFVSDGPTGKQIAGDVLRTGALFTPAGKIAGAVSKGVRPALGLTKIGAGTTPAVTTGFKEGASRIAGLSAGGGVSGLGFDVGAGLRDQEAPSFLATGVGVGLPPALKATGALVRGAGFLASELAGVSTGAGGKSIQEFYKAVREGGPRAKKAIEGFKGKVSEDVIVQDAALSLDKVIQRRNSDYITKFEKVINNKQQLDISPINNKVTEMLSKFKVKTVAGELDFSQSALRFNTQAQKEMREIVNTMKTYGTKSGDRTPLGVDLLKQSIDDIFTESSRVKAFTASIRGETRKVLSKVKGYDKIQKDYEEKTRFIKEVRNTFGLKDTTTIDSKLKRLLSSLSQQKGFRDEIIQQLDDESGSFITAQIAGQQLKELLPSGILRVFGPTGAGIATLFAGKLIGILPMLQALAIMSPKSVGFFLRGLGATARQSDKMSEVILKLAPKGARTPGDVLLK